MFFLQAPGQRLVSRGDVAVYDFEIGDFTCDWAWHDLPISGIVPVNTKWALFRVRYEATSDGAELEVREKGHVATLSSFITRAQIANLSVVTTQLLSVGSDRMWEYRARSQTVNIEFVIKAWM